MTDRNALHDPNEPPEDVASLYSWANLHGAKYRDFSASRAQNREKARMQMQQAVDEQQRAQRDMELQQAEAARDAAQAALAAERARQAEIDAHYAAQQAALQAAQQAAYEAAQLAARQTAQQAAHEAAQEAARQEAARQAAEQAAREARAAQLAAQQAAQQAAQELARQAAEHAAQQAAQEMARQAAEQAAREARAAQEAAEQAALHAAEEMARQAAEQAAREARAAHEAAERAAEQAAREAAERAAHEAEQERARQAAEQAAEEARIAQAQAAQQAAEQAAQEMARQAAEQAAEEARLAELQAAQHAEAARAAQQAAQQAAWQQPIPERLSPSSSSPQAGHFGFPAAFPLPGAEPQRTTQRITAREEAAPARTPWSAPEPREIPARPAWLAERPSLSGIPTVTQAPEDTLQGSRERLTSRWFALKGVFDTGGNAVADVAVPAAATSRAPVLAIFSLAGGVGKTSMVATLGRALSSRGERVLLVDTAAFGLLPFFFGARDQRPGQLRTFSPPAASGDAPIQMVAVDPESLGPENGGQEPLTAEIQQHIRSVGRVIVDLATASGSTTRRLLRLSPSVLVPVIPDMNSVVSVGSIDAFFERNSSIAGKASLPHYVLNQFDASLPLHLDVREVLREQLGDRLLPFALRRAPAISEALAEGMTVMDYAPNSTVAEDFGTLAGWVKSQSAPASSGFRGVRWSER